MPFIQEQNEIREDYKIGKKSSQVKVVLNSRPTRGIAILFCVSILAPVLIYYFIFEGTSPDNPTETCSVEKTYRVPCGKGGNVSLDYCGSINCCFDNSTKSCYHYLPSRYFYYDDTGDASFQRSRKQSPFGRDQLENIALTVRQKNVNVIQIVIHDTSVVLAPGMELKDTNYYHELSKNPFYIEVYRNETKDLLLTTAKGPTIASNNYWEWSFQLTDEFLFGLGQTLITLDENSTLTKVIYGSGLDHNTLPLFMAYKNGKWHGLMVQHQGPLEVTVLPSKLVILKCLAGNSIALEVSVGPGIQEVMAQQSLKKSDVDLDTLGVHVCREGSTSDLREILDDYKNEKTVNSQFDYHSDCLHENLIVALRSDYNNDRRAEVIQAITEYITDPGYTFTLSLPPQVTFLSQLYNDTAGLNLFFKNSTGNYRGLYLDKNVVYPYFKHQRIDQFVQELVEEVEGYFGPDLVKDLVLVKNWPVDESFEMGETNTFQYLSEYLKEAMSLTLPWNVTINSSLHYLDHNDYGSSQVATIAKGFDQSTVMTASHNLDTVQPIIIQNVDISWSNLRKAITTTLSNSLFGFPLTSFPVCGSTNTFNSSYESLCLRWYYMAATAPIFRISSDSPRRDPSSLLTLSSYLSERANWAIELRNTLKYYLYTVLKSGEPLMRPMFYDFPNDVETFALVDQYMVGRDLLVAHPTLPDQTLLKVYLPGGTWFEFGGGGSYGKGWISLGIVESDWVGFVREGAVIPLVEKDSGDETVLKISLKVGLKCDSGNCTASGSMRVDSDSLVTFTSTDQELKIENEQQSDFVLSQVEIFKSGSDSVRYKTDPGVNLYDISSCSYSRNPDGNPLLECT